MYILLFQKMM